MDTLTDPEQERLQAVLKKYDEALRAIPGVVDAGIGFKRVGGKYTDTAAIVVKVHHKRSPEDILEECIIPAELDGVATDVQETDVRLHVSPMDRHPLLLGGISIKNTRRKSLGTLGAIVYDRVTGAALGLTNHHILFGRHIPVFRRGGQIGDPVIQPGPSGNQEDVIGTVLRGDEDLDCAVFTLNGSRPIDEQRSQLGLVGRFQGMTAPRLGMRVRKSGARTGVTYGIITYLGEDALNITPNAEKPAPRNEISMSGDSGAVWGTDADVPSAVGLHTGGDKDGALNQESAFARVISRVADRLGIRF